MLTFGMMWFSAEKDKPLEEIILNAAAYYEKKYKVRPDTVLTHRSIKAQQIKDIQLLPDQWILTNHYLVGVENGSKQSA